MQTVKLAGLVSTKQYSVWCDDGSLLPADYTGAELMDRGLQLRLANRYSSDLIHIQEARLPKPAGYVVPQPVAKAAALTYGNPLPEEILNKIGFDPDPIRTRFVWQRSPNARCYRVSVSHNEDISQPVSERVVYATEAELPGFPNGDLFARVDAIGWKGIATGKQFKVQAYRTPEKSDGKIHIQHASSAP